MVAVSSDTEPINPSVGHPLPTNVYMIITDIVPKDHQRGERRGRIFKHLVERRGKSISRTCPRLPLSVVVI